MNRLLRPLMRIRSKLCGRAGQHQNSEFTMRPPPSVQSAKDGDMLRTAHEAFSSGKVLAAGRASVSESYLTSIPPYSGKWLKMEPLKKQIGGDHYTVRAIQPIEYINANRMGFCEGNVIKYVTRYKEKDGKKDLEKAIHYLQLLIQMEYGDAEKAKRDEDTAEKWGLPNIKTSWVMDGGYEYVWEDGAGWVIRESK